MSRHHGYGYKRRKTTDDSPLNMRFDRMIEQLSTTRGAATDAGSSIQSKKTRPRARSSSSGPSHSSYDGPRTPSDLHDAFEVDVDDGRSSGRLGDEFAIMKMKSSATIRPRNGRKRRQSSGDHAYDADILIEDEDLDTCTIEDEREFPGWLLSTFNSLHQNHPLRALGSTEANSLASMLPETASDHSRGFPGKQTNDTELHEGINQSCPHLNRLAPPFRSKLAADEPVFAFMPPPTATVGVVPTPRTPRLVEDIKEHDTTIYATSPPGCATPYNFVTPGPYARLIQHPSVSSPYPPSVSLAAVGQGLYHSSPSNLNAQVTDPFARPGPYARQTPSSDLATPSYRGPGRVSPSFSPIPGNSRVETTILALRTDRRPFSTAVFNGESSPFLGQFHDDLDGGGAYRADHHPEWFIHDTPSAPNNIPASPKHYLSQPATRDIYVNDPVLYHAGEETHVRAGSQDEFAVEVDYDTLDFEWRPLKRKNVDSRRSSSPTPETFLTQSLKDRSVLGYSEVEWPTHLRGTRPHGHIARIHQAKTVVSLTPPYDEGLASYEGAGPDMTLNVFYQSHHDSPPPTLRQMQPSSEERVPIATSSSSSLRSNTPDVNEDHTGSPSNAKEPAGPAFAPAPGVYVSPLRTPATQPPPATPSLKAETDEVETPKMVYTSLLRRGRHSHTNILQKPISAFACRLSVNGVVVDSTTASVGPLDDVRLHRQPSTAVIRPTRQVSPQSEDSIESWTEDAGIIQ